MLKRLLHNYNIFIRLDRVQLQRVKKVDCVCVCVSEGHFKTSWTGGSAPLLSRGRRCLLRQVVVVRVT
jgi:hypothetical protein